MNNGFLLRAAMATAIALPLTGCGLAPAGSTITAAPVATVPQHPATLSGIVHGGQQPVTSGSVYLLAAGTTGNYGPSTSLLNTAAGGVSTDLNGDGYVVTDSNGYFTLTGDYTCPTANTEVYAAAVGGNPGLGGSSYNFNLTMMAALGPCGNLTSASFISINELTTVAAVWALGPFMTDLFDIGTSVNNPNGIVNAFAAASELANSSAGTLPGLALPAGAVLPSSKINTLADILAACINSNGGSAGDGSACGNLFAAATQGSNQAPQDTVAAALSIEQSPTLHPASLFALAQASPPFQPALGAAPTDWTLAVQHTAGGFNNPRSIAIDAQGNAWIANCGSANCTTNGAGSITELSPLGAPVATPYTAGGINIPVSIAIDALGDAWIANQGGNSVTELTSAGVPVVAAYTGGGLSAPSSIAIDGLGNVWITNSGNSSVTEISGAGSVLSPSGGFTGGGVSAPIAIVTSPH